jgi:DNA repair exonuclease SbcCD ATPase subunit
MLKLKSISLKNFMSFGNVLQTLHLNTEQLTLVLGENLDVPSNAGSSRNGCGKSSLLQAICFGLYGVSLSNIRKDNLINLTNEKNLEVVLEFEKNGIDYRIERGRKPHYFKFFVDNKELAAKEKDEAQGESRETQREVERIVGVSCELFKQIIGLNTYSLPFLSLPAKDQRDIVEELLGITQLSEKAEKLRELLKETKDCITQEEFKIKAVTETNEKIQRSIVELRNKSLAWDKKHQTELDNLQTQIESLLDIDVEADIILHKNYEKSNNLNASLLKAKREKTSKENSLNELKRRKKQYEIDLKSALEHSCPTCHQSVHDERQKEITGSLTEKIAEITNKIVLLEPEITEIILSIETFSAEIKELGIVARPHYTNIDDAYNHRTKLDSLTNRLERAIEEKNPLDEHLIGQQEALLQKIDLENIQSLTTLRDHQDFLMKLLTNKDSAVRKKIIDQNLNYLNSRLRFYTEKLGLPHSVTFMNDLSVNISEHGRELDFGNFSRGESTRLILSLSFSFRDIFESLTGSVNLFYIDELLDAGADGACLEAALELLKKMSRENNRSIFLISHHEELIPRCNNVLLVVKENGFSKISAEEVI